MEYKKAMLSQRWPRDAPYIRMPWKNSAVPGYAHDYTFPEIVNGLFCNRSYETAYTFWKS